VADDPNPTLRAELEAAKTVIIPTIRGMRDLAGVSTPALSASLSLQANIRDNRLNLIQRVLDDLNAVVAALTALESDGYPALPTVSLDPGQFSELQLEKTDIEAAIATFTQEAAASSLAVNLGEPVPKPS
jgi:hypothetical protein